MAKKETKKSDQNELIENPEVIAEKIVPGEDFLKSNSKILAGVLAVAIVLIGGILFFQYNTQQQNEKAQAEMFQAVYFFEQDSVDFALNGDGINKGFLNIIESYPRTDAANLSHFYTGSIYLSQKKFEDALTKFLSTSTLEKTSKVTEFQLIDYNLGYCYFKLNKYPEAIRSFKIVLQKKDLENNIIKIWDCILDAENGTKSSSSKIVLCCQGERKTHNKYKWEYYEK